MTSPRPVPAGAGAGIAAVSVRPGRLRRRLDLFVVLIGRDLKLRYKRSVLGIGWSLITPLAQLVVFHFVFTIVLPLGIPRYASFLFIGIAVWNWFSMSLDQSTGSIVDNRELVRQPGFPTAILPVVTVASNLTNFLLALPILGAFIALEGGLPVSPALLLLPLLVALQFALTAGIAYFVATFHVTFRDTRHLLGVVLTLGFYLTPVFYGVNQVPARYADVYALNPMVPLLAGYRSILLDGEWPAATGLTWLVVMAVLVLWTGRVVFRRASDRFVDEL